MARYEIGGGSGGPGGVFPDIRIPTVAADGVTDDRATIQSVLNSLPATGGTVWLTGLCYIGSGGTSGGAPFGLVIPRDNVTITGAPGAGLVSNVSGIRLIVAAGHGKTSATNPYDTAQWLTSDTPWAISGTVVEGATSITLSTPANAGNLAAGDLIFIRTGQLVDTALSREPDSELNEVLTANAGTGVVTLKYPTAKPYAQEYYITGTTGFTSTSVTANAAPYGVVKASGRVLRNLTLRGLKLWQTDATSGTNTALSMQAAWGVTVEDCDIMFGKYGISGRYSRDVKITRCRLHTVGTSSDNDPSWIGPSTGCGDWVIQSCRGSGVTPAKIHSHEGIHDLHYIDWISRTPSGAGDSGASNVSIRQRAYRHVYDLDMTGCYTAASCDMVAVTIEVPGDPGTVHFRRLRLRGTPGRAHLFIQPTSVTIDPDGLDLPAGAVATYSAGVDPLSQQIIITAGALVSSTATPTLETATVGAAWLLDATTQEAVATTVSIPARWRSWQVEADVQATTAPTGGADVVRLQHVTSQGGGGTTSSAQVSVTLPDATTTVSPVVGTAALSTTGSVNIRLLRVAANASDTYAADLRLRAVRIRRLA